MAAASFMLAHQIAAKAARDGLFLSRFPATDLPKIVAFRMMVSYPQKPLEDFSVIQFIFQFIHGCQADFLVRVMQF